MTEIINYVFGDVQIHNDYMIVIMRSGVHVTPEYNNVLLELVDQYYKVKPFVYLTYRKNRYTVDPAIYFETSKIKNLAGFGVIAEAPLSGANAAVEKLFLNKPFEIFNEPEAAKTWAKSIIKNESSRT
ncbi:MAG: hypothetical protein KJO49_02165 [Bacteroidia bacterium]|nr:hypothetical protein [Bacteroidia bacterium]NNK71356.1 hypothetical protein [Flavobacteriaceae bacterium]NNL80502.1 hypothetical protein [Flavobacteriaceae bacterium]